MSKAKRAKQGKKAKGTAPAQTLSNLTQAVANLGRAATNTASDVITRITGGTQNVLNNTLWSNGAPSVRNTRDGFNWNSAERVTPIIGSTGFNLSTYLINPGNATLFPVLSNLARNFESYEFKGLVFFYVPRSGTATSTPGQGIAALATQYNVLNANFVDSDEMLNYKYSISRAPYEKFWHPVECRKNHTVFSHQYITDVTAISSLPERADPQIYYHGKLSVATDGNVDGTSKLGELWVAYDVVLYTMKAIPPALSYRGTFSRETRIRCSALIPAGSSDIYLQETASIPSNTLIYSSDPSMTYTIINNLGVANLFWNCPENGVYEYQLRILAKPASGTVTGVNPVITVNGNAFDTGLVSTPYLCEAYSAATPPSMSNSDLYESTMFMSNTANIWDSALMQYSFNCAKDQVIQICNTDEHLGTVSIAQTNAIYLWAEIKIRFVKPLVSSEFTSVEVPPPSRLRRSRCDDDVVDVVTTDDCIPTSSSCSSSSARNRVDTQHLLLKEKELKEVHFRR